jgi:hypothetical protein
VAERRKKNRSNSSRKSGNGQKPGGGKKKPGIKVPVKKKGPPWDVAYHPDAREELTDLRKANEDDHEAVMRVISYLKLHGPKLPSPHQSAVRGREAKGLRELRPTQGKTLVRPLYRRFKNVFVILAIGPEAMVDQGGFDKTVRRAQARRKDIDDAN